MQIRKATENDIETIQNIATITWYNTYTFLSKEQMEYMLDWMYSKTSLQQQMNDGHQFYIAANDDMVVSFASVNKENEAICKLNKLYVLPTTQKTGAGKLLLEKVIEYARENDCSELQLQVNRNNAAKSFYLKHGFEILYSNDFEIGNGFFMNDYVMGLKL